MGLSRVVELRCRGRQVRVECVCMLAANPSSTICKPPLRQGLNLFVSCDLSKDWRAAFENKSLTHIVFNASSSRNPGNQA